MEALGWATYNVGKGKTALHHVRSIPFGLPLILLALLSGCQRLSVVREDEGSQTSGLRKKGDFSRIYELPVAPGEVVVANQQVPLDVSIRCHELLVRGFGEYKDVAWIVPPLFLARLSGNEKGYTFTQTGPGTYEIAFAFRVWRSPYDTASLSPADKSKVEDRFCDIWVAGMQLRDSGFARIALMPIESLTARLDVRGKPHLLKLNLGPTWNKEAGFTGTAELTEHEYRDLDRDITQGSGTQVTFRVATKARRTGCTQTVDLDGADTVVDQRLRDGETAAVSLRRIKLAVYLLGSSRNRNVHIDGDCGSQSIASPDGPADDTTMFTCSRSGQLISCLFEGNFTIEPFVVLSFLTIIDRPTIINRP